VRTTLDGLEQALRDKVQQLTRGEDVIEQLSHELHDTQHDLAQTVERLHVSESTISQLRADLATTHQDVRLCC
jgi:septal ring factor EnvC (AmiA/AmiB activator)